MVPYPLPAAAGWLGNGLPGLALPPQPPTDMVSE
jgi:hypothetical protein